MTSHLSRTPDPFRRFPTTFKKFENHTAALALHFLHRRREVGMFGKIGNQTGTQREDL